MGNKKKKLTLQETIEYIDSRNKLDEISSGKMLGVYNYYEDNHYGGRTKQRNNIKNEIIERTPLKIEFTGEIFGKFSRTKKIAIVIYKEKTIIFEKGSIGRRRFDSFFKALGFDVENLEESQVSSLGLNNKVKKKFSSTDEISNLGMFSPSIENTFDMFFIKEDGSVNQFRNIRDNYIANDYDGDENDKDSATEKIVFELFKNALKIKFGTPSDCRRYIRFMSEIIRVCWGVDISKNIDWHELIV